MRREILLLFTIVVFLLPIKAVLANVEPEGGVVIYVPISSGGIFTIFPTLSEGLPDDPGSAGTATLAGVDADTDGIRDDLEVLIAERFPANPGTRNALYIYVSGIQQIITASSPQSVIHADGEATRGFGCLVSNLRSRGLTLNDAMQIAGEITAEVLNTLDRAYAYADNKELRGYAAPQPTVFSCAI